MFEPPRPIVWIALLGYGALFAPTLAFLYEDWTDSIWQNGHGILLPLLLWAWALHLLRRLPAVAPGADPEQGSAMGLVAVALGAMLAIHDAHAGVGHLGALGLVISLPGLSLLLLGSRATRQLAPVWVLALFLVPLPTESAYWLGLPRAAAAVGEAVLEATGMPVLRNESILVVPGYRFAVSDRCSGVAALYAGVALAVFLAFHTSSPIRRAVLLVAPWILVVVSSGVRVGVLVFATRYTGLDVIEMATHGLSGIAAFWAVVAGLVLLSDWRQLRVSFA